VGGGDAFGMGKGGAKGPPFVPVPYEPPTGFTAIDKYVKLQVKMPDLPLLDMEREMRIDSTLYKVKMVIKEKHDHSLSKIRLYLGHVDPKTIINATDDATLSDLGIQGGSQGNDEHVATIYYDFDTSHIDCPILLDSPRKEGSRAAALHAAALQG